MKFGLNKGYTILLSVLLLCVSCGDADLFDTDKWSGQIEGWEPGVKAAVAHGEFTLWDFLQDTAQDAAIKKEWINGDSILVIKYTKEDIYSVDIAEVFELKKTDIVFGKTFDLPDDLQAVVGVTGGAKVEDVFPDGYELKDTIEESIPLPDEFDGTLLKQITLSKGTCTYLLPKLDDVKYNVKVSYLSEGQMKTLLEKTELEGGQENQIPLQDMVFDLKDNQIKLVFDIKLNEGEYRGADFMVQIRFVNYDFRRIEGKVVKTGGIAIDKDYFDLDIDFLNEIGGDFKFTDPQLNVVVRNKGLGLPVAVDMAFDGQDKDGKKGTLTLKQPLTFAGNPSITETKTFSARIDKGNSDIVDFLSLPPQGNVYYWGKVSLNPDGENNVIYNEGSLDMDVNISIPLALTGKLSYCDTLTDLDIDQKYADQIVEGTIYLKVLENALPLDLSVPKLILLDENNRHLDTIVVVSGDGKDNKIKAGDKGTLSFYIGEKPAKDLGKTKNILLEAVVEGDTGEPVKADAKLKFVLTLEARAEIKDYNDF